MKSMFKHLNTDITDKIEFNLKYTPQYDMYETKDWYELIILLPGIPNKKYCKIVFDDDILTISVDRDFTPKFMRSHRYNETIINETNYICYPKQFVFKLKIDCIIDTNKILSELLDGLLTVKLFKIK